MQSDSKLAHEPCPTYDRAWDLRKAAALIIAACFQVRCLPQHHRHDVSPELPTSRTGHLLSILDMIRSAKASASAMADSNAGEGRPSQFARRRAAKMLAAISRTRLRPSSTNQGYHLSPYIRLIKWH